MRSESTLEMLCKLIRNWLEKIFYTSPKHVALQQEDQSLIMLILFRQLPGKAKRITVYLVYEKIVTGEPFISIIKVMYNQNRCKLSQDKPFRTSREKPQY